MPGVAATGKGGGPGGEGPCQTRHSGSGALVGSGRARPQRRLRRRAPRPHPCRHRLVLRGGRGRCLCPGPVPGGADSGQRRPLLPTRDQLGRPGPLRRPRAGLCAHGHEPRRLDLLGCLDRDRHGPVGDGSVAGRDGVVANRTPAPGGGFRLRCRPRRRSRKARLPSLAPHRCCRPCSRHRFAERRHLGCRGSHPGRRLRRHGVEA